MRPAPRTSKNMRKEPALRKPGGLQIHASLTLSTHSPVDDREAVAPGLLGVTLPGPASTEVTQTRACLVFVLLLLFWEASRLLVEF